MIKKCKYGEIEIQKGNEIERLIKEANELTAIFTATNKTAKTNTKPKS